MVLRPWRSLGERQAFLIRWQLVNRFLEQQQVEGY